MSVSFISASELQCWIDTKECGVDFLIIDVRDSDFETGNIPNCKNIPSDIFLKTPLNFDLKAENLVFHCALSQVRGPKCAQTYARLTGKDVFVLQGYN
jgi:rhodanese-related sulfurtransferase